MSTVPTAAKAFPEFFRLHKEQYDKSDQDDHDDQYLEDIHLDFLL